MRILVLRGGAIGDFIVTLPALGLLRRQWPSAHIACIGNPRAAELALGRYYLDAVYSQHDAKWAALYGDTALSAPLQEFFGSFDLVINYWPDPDNTLAHHMTQLGFGPPRTASKIFLSISALATKAPAARHYAEPLSQLGLIADDFVAKLYLKNDDIASADSILAKIAVRGRPLVAFHPGSGSVRKNWPVERWEQLIRQMHASTSTHLLLIGGEADAAVLRTLSDTLTDSPFSVLDNLPLPSLAAVLQRCHLFIGHDSGISHIASAVGTRSLLMFGPTDSAIWAPRGAAVTVIQRGSTLEAIDVDDVLCTAKAVLNEPSIRPN
ncbi:MAG TPA: glycosyltransferase family 9 protein [Opitutaceae bacterium]|nr:glycosyltransferase family 9 protein [Opitutaceae bacterium]